MILQKDSRLNTAINKYGCYFMSLLWWVNKKVGYEFDPREISRLYNIFIDREDMRRDCFVHRPKRILSYLGLEVEEVTKTGYSQKCLEGQFEILYFERSSKGRIIPHFVAGDGEGHVTYDPWGESRTVREGVLTSKRIFTEEL